MPNTLTIVVCSILILGIVLFKQIKLYRRLEEKEDKNYCLGLILFIGFYMIAMLAITVRTIILTS